MVWHHSPLDTSHARHIIMRVARPGRSPLAAAFDPPGQRLKLIASGEDWVMFRKVALFSIALLTGVGALMADAEAVVYCRYVGVPKGCVAKPGVVLAAPPTGAAVRAATPGAGAAGVGVLPGAGVGAPGVGVAPRVGTPNGGGPVNRPGLR